MVYHEYDTSAARLSHLLSNGYVSAGHLLDQLSCRCRLIRGSDKRARSWGNIGVSVKAAWQVRKHSSWDRISFKFGVTWRREGAKHTCRYRTEREQN